jgi:hypothetical protein
LRECAYRIRLRLSCTVQVVMKARACIQNTRFLITENHFDQTG